MSWNYPRQASTSNRSGSSTRLSVSRRVIQIFWLWAFAALGVLPAQAEGCPTAKDEIATDRPDVTNSSLVVPTGSLQNENGVNFSMRDDGRAIDAPTPPRPLGA